MARQIVPDAGDGDQHGAVPGGGTVQHREHIVLHELGHVLSDHVPADVLEEELVKALMPDLDFRMVQRVLGKSRRPLDRFRSRGERDGMRAAATPHFRTRRASLVVGLVMVLFVSSFAPASAYTFTGCKYDSGSISPIQYRFYSVTSTYVNAFQGAQAEWDQTSSPGYFGESTTSFDPEIPVHDGSYSGSYWAQVGWSCDSDGTYSGNEVSYLRFDTSDMSGLRTSQREKVAMHELGHTYGLGHVTSSYCRVMEQGTDKFSCSYLPDYDAVNGVNALY